MTYTTILAKTREAIDNFPEPHRTDILDLWEEWVKTDPQSPLYVSWSEFANKTDDPNILFTERRVFLKKIKNDLRDSEIPLKHWQKIAKGLAAAASAILIVFLALSRVFRVAD